MAFREELRLKTEIYERFRRKAETKSLLTVTEDKWVYVAQRWSYVTSRTRLWQWKLDNNLPGRLGQLGDWLYRAEELLDSEASYSDRPEEAAATLRTLLEEHKVSICIAIEA